MSIYGGGLPFWIIVCSEIRNTSPVLINWLRENGSAEKFHHLLIPETLRLQKFQRQLRGAGVKCSFKRESASYWGKKICLVNTTQNRVVVLISRIMGLHSCVLWPVSWPVLDSRQSFDDMKLVYVQGTQEFQHSILIIHPSPRQFLKW